MSLLNRSFLVNPSSPQSVGEKAMAKKYVDAALNQPSVDQLSNLIEESTRSTKEGARFFVEPAGNTLSRALSKRHHIIFGRRGSGKSSLLHKVLTDARADRSPIVYVDMDSLQRAQLSRRPS